MIKRLKVVCVQTINGEKHYVVQSLEGDENPANSRDFDEAEVRKTMKKKPLNRFFCHGE